jgi:hypothetical protein
MGPWQEYMAAPTTLRLVDPVEPADALEPREIDLGDSDTTVVIDENGVARIENQDGSVTFDENPDLNAAEIDGEDFYRNLANEIDDAELSLFASELLTGIELDIQSRKDWMETRATGIKLLGLKIEEPRGDLGAASAPLEGMSTIRHPLLLEATVRFQATARGELLPATGPVKVRNDLPMPPAPPPAPPGASPAPGIGDNGGPPLVPEGQAMDDLGEALEKDFNHYLTVTATEYVPDTDRMLFYVGFGGDGFKKVYNCPLRRRPVSESVDADDIIVSNAATDMRNCGRVTHRIKMRPSILKRMQIIGAYRDVALGSPNPSVDITSVEREKAEVGGYKPRPQQPKDAEYEVYECYCELDIPKFAPEQFKGKGLPLPYVVTMEKESRQVLAVTRNWDEADEQALTKQFFVQFPFIRGLGFYGLGLIHLLGNVTMALTAIWRIMIDNGMFANFPGFLFAKGAGRQNSNLLRVPPGGGAPVDVPPGTRIQDAFMPLPYKETGAAFTGLATHIEEVGQRLGQTADVNIGEGKQDMPVGTTMALIEQATKIMDSVHKRLHAAQAEEFALLKERFREDPEAFWRHNKKTHQPARKWTEEQFIQALDQRELVPVADPNNPTSLHRIAKATIIDMLVSKYPQDMDKRGSLKRILRIADIDSEGLMTQQTAPAPPDPRMVAIQAKADAEKLKAEIEKVRVFIQAQTAQANLTDKAQDREFKERLKQFDMYLEQVKAQAQLTINAHETEQESLRAQREIEVEQVKAASDVATGHMSHRAGLAQEGMTHQQQLAADREKHQQEMAQARERHEQDKAHAREKHEADLEHKRALAAIQARAKPKENM